MTQTKHLKHNGEIVWCEHCRHEFCLPSSVLVSPYRLLEAKENIAKKHKCRGPVIRARIVTLHPSITADDLSAYYTKAMRRMLPV